ncbi:hypothetical protein BJX63DRAFT_392234, partial [Aspergillus granulosus]
MDLLGHLNHLPGKGLDNRRFAARVNIYNRWLRKCRQTDYQSRYNCSLQARQGIFSLSLCYLFHVLEGS